MSDLRDIVTIKLDHEITKKLAARAESLGLSLDAYLPMVLRAEANGEHHRPADRFVKEVFKKHGALMRRLADH